MFLCWWLSLVALIPMTISINPGVKVKLTTKGIEYGRQLALASIQQKLKTIRIDDMSGKVKVSRIGKVKYSLTNLKMVDVGLPEATLNMVPGTGVRLSIGNAFFRLQGNWRVKYLIVSDSGSFNLNVNGISIGEHTFQTWSKLAVQSVQQYVENAIRKAMQKQICPLVANAVSDLNNNLKTLNVLAKVDQFAEIEYSMVASPAVSTTSIDLSLKGEFYNIGKHQEPPFTPAAFSLPPQINNMLYIGLSSFTANSAAFVYNSAGAFSQYITDDMIPKASPIRLTTGTFGVFIPQIAKQFPGLMMKLLVKTVKTPIITFETNNATVQAFATATAYAIQPNATLSPLFVLNLDSSVSARVFVSGTRVAGALTLNKMDLTLATSYVGDFQVRSLDSIFQTVLKWVVIPTLNVDLAKGYPLPTLGKMTLVNTQLQVLKDYLMIGTDVQFKG
ncbi:hypothetical protein PBY51_013693 [Eleginops maclovinus]|uniref:Bactericidal permeability-increasing protein n=1 Tax=Eleginops maclovinus TaxID=56733 RepID=A0AAN7XZS1_ELEMC|nr:hypothetical protein PBY51_013693 [Eleginops maclovinus]